MQLSDRLKCVAHMVTKNNIVADVGCDHAFTSIYLIENKIASHVIAMDVNPGPLSHARNNIEKHGLNNEIEICLSNGLDAIDEADGVETVLISGMGGNLIIDILKKNADIINGLYELILQPQSDIYKVRHYLHEIGYYIDYEKMVYEDSKFYNIIHAVHGNEVYEYEYEYLYGKYLLDKPDSLTIKFLEYIYKKNETALAAIDTCSDNTDRQQIRKREIINTDNIIKNLLVRLKSSIQNNQI